MWITQNFNGNDGLYKHTFGRRAHYQVTWSVKTDEKIEHKQTAQIHSLNLDKPMNMNKIEKENGRKRQKTDQRA